MQVDAVDGFARAAELDHKRFPVAPVRAAGEDLFDAVKIIISVSLLEGLTELICL